MTFPESWTLPATDKITRRPIYERFLRRKHCMHLYPPTEAEKQDAVLILKDPWVDELTAEAFNVFDECGRG